VNILERERQNKGTLDLLNISTNIMYCFYVLQSTITHVSVRSRSLDLDSRARRFLEIVSDQHHPPVRPTEIAKCALLLEFLQLLLVQINSLEDYIIIYREYRYENMYE